MKKTTKRILAAMSASAMLMSVAAVSADELSPEAKDFMQTLTSSDSSKIGVPIVQLGTPQSATDHGYVVGSMIVGENGDVITSEGGDLVLVKQDGAFVLNAFGDLMSFEDIKAGDVITYYVDGDAPMTLQLPVHYSPAVIVIEDEEAAVSRKIAVFDEDHLSDDGSLVINYDLETPYYSHTREAAFISGKALVFYNMMTMSIPAQTNPLAIVRLNGDSEGPNTPALVPIAPVPDKAEGIDLSAVTEIKAGEKTIAHIPVTVNGTQMIPVRVVAEALGFTVEWNGETRTVDVGHAFFNIDEDAYTIGRAMPEALGQAPVLIALPGEEAAQTYVPVAFFTNVLGMTVTVDGATATIQQ